MREVAGGDVVDVTRGRRSRCYARAQYARVKVGRSMRSKAGHCTRIMREVAGGDAVYVTRGRITRRHALSAGGDAVNVTPERITRARKARPSRADRAQIKRRSRTT